MFCPADLAGPFAPCPMIGNKTKEVVIAALHASTLLPMFVDCVLLDPQYGHFMFV